jgi:catechol 2,3-dioxygenase-like lactoylglutathione lyase family enzyme
MMQASFRSDHMRLNHLDLHVPDVAATRDFFVVYFGFRLVEMRGRDGLAILEDNSGLQLVISNPIAKFGSADTPTAGWNTYHIGFNLPSSEDVDNIYNLLRAGGADVLKPPSAIRGEWRFYCFAPGRVLVEVGCLPLI